MRWPATTSGPSPLRSRRRPPDDGPGGPILVISSVSNPFGRYYGEILRGRRFQPLSGDRYLEGVSLDAGRYDVVILGEMALTAGQVTMLSDWVTRAAT